MTILASWTTRPAQAADDGFLLSLYATTRYDEVASWGWTREQAEAFLQMQFHVRQRSYELQTPDAKDRIILAEGRPIGRLLVDRSGGDLLLVDIALVPEARDAGIGTSVMRDLQVEAAHLGKPIRLTTEKSGRAVRLYERLGFVRTGETPFNIEMGWHPGSSSTQG